MSLINKRETNDFPKTALILAAGRGTRLEEMTDNLPKCLIEVGSQSLLIRMLKELEEVGIQEAILVVGYQAEMIMKLVGDAHGEMKISYVINSEWETTNNVFSLYLAVEKIKSSFLLLESDLILESGAFELFDSSNAMAVDKYSDYMDGTVVALTETNIVSDMFLKSSFDRPDDLSDFYKTVNIYSLKYDDFHKTIVPILKELLDEDRLDVYYELAFARAINRGQIQFKAIDFEKLTWAEIDDQEDWKRAQQMFSGELVGKGG